MIAMADTYAAGRVQNFTRGLRIIELFTGPKPTAPPAFDLAGSWDTLVLELIEDSKLAGTHTYTVRWEEPGLWCVWRGEV